MRTILDRTLILSVIGKDKPGLTRIIAEAVHDAGGNWLESQLSRIGGRYVGAVLVAVPSGDAARLEQAIRAIDPAGLTVTVAPADNEGALPSAAVETVRLELVGQDTPGIVREVSAVLADLSVNIVALETSVEPAAWSGGALFRAVADLVLPGNLSTRHLSEALEHISAEIQVDIDLKPAGERGP